MGATKQFQLEQAGLCDYCERRPREMECPYCSTPTCCRQCHERGYASRVCDGCAHMLDKDD